MQRISRRTVLKGGLAMAAAFTTHGCATTSGGRDLIGFRPVPKPTIPARMPIISPDYEYQTLIPWGTPLAPNGPPYNHLSLIHISEPTRPERIGGCRVGV